MGPDAATPPEAALAGAAPDAAAAEVAAAVDATVTIVARNRNRRMASLPMSDLAMSDLAITDVAISDLAVTDLDTPRRLRAAGAALPTAQNRTPQTSNFPRKPPSSPEIATPRRSRSPHPGKTAL